jgi:hypothetical protein
MKAAIILALIVTLALAEIIVFANQIGRGVTYIATLGIISDHPE